MIRRPVPALARKVPFSAHLRKKSANAPLGHAMLHLRTISQRPTRHYMSNAASFGSLVVGILDVSQKAPAAFKQLDDDFNGYFSRLRGTSAVKSEVAVLKSFAAAILGLSLFGLGNALAEDCSPHCDYWHYYGPYDFSYIQPGLFAYPRCDRQGNCSPYLIYIYSGHRYGRIIIRPVLRTATRPRP